MGRHGSRRPRREYTAVDDEILRACTLRYGSHQMSRVASLLRHQRRRARRSERDYGRGSDSESGDIQRRLDTGRHDYSTPNPALSSLEAAAWSWQFSQDRLAATVVSVSSPNASTTTANIYKKRRRSTPEEHNHNCVTEAGGDSSRAAAQEEEIERLHHVITGIKGQLERALLTTPDHWQEQDGNVRLVQIWPELPSPCSQCAGICVHDRQRTEEGCRVLRQFSKSLQRAHRVLRIERVQNIRLLRKYQLGLLDLEDPNEQSLYHGSSPANTADILEHGFDFRLASQHGSLGRGTYFARTANYSHSYTASKIKRPRSYGFGTQAAVPAPTGVSSATPPGMPSSGTPSGRVVLVSGGSTPAATAAPAASLAAVHQTPPATFSAAPAVAGGDSSGSSSPHGQSIPSSSSTLLPFTSAPPQAAARSATTAPSSYDAGNAKSAGPLTEFEAFLLEISGPSPAPAAPKPPTAPAPRPGYTRMAAAPQPKPGQHSKLESNQHRRQAAAAPPQQPAAVLPQSQWPPPAPGPPPSQAAATAPPMYPQQHAHGQPSTTPPPEEPPPERQMLLCKVALGKVCVGKRGMVRPQPLPSPSSGFHDSVSNKEGTIFTVFTNEQAYPEYCVTYTTHFEF